MFETVRNDFPQLSRIIGGKPLVYLDSTATSLKPRSVIDVLNGYYRNYSANVFRGIYTLSEEATHAYEEGRETIAKLIHAKTPKEVIFTRNTSESINLVYYSWAKHAIQKGDSVVTTIMEHHSNFVPWQELAKSTGCTLKIWNVEHTGLLDEAKLEQLIDKKTKLIAITAASNVLGTLVDVKKITDIVKRICPTCLVLVDGAQAVPHMPVNVVSWGADFVAFSGHKMLGPTGIGVLWGKSELLDTLPPYQYGGDMIREVHVDRTVYADIPHKFEAGTPHIAGVIGLGEAAKYLMKLDLSQVRKHERDITSYALKSLNGLSGVTVWGPDKAQDRGGVIAFSLGGVHPHDVAQMLNEDNVCIRVGFHCAQPLHEFLGCGPTCRASFYVYSTKDDVDALVSGLEKVKRIFL